MTVTLACTQRHWDLLIKELDAPVETAWVALARLVHVEGLQDLTLLIRDVREVPSDTYVERLRGRLTLEPAGWLPFFTEAANDASFPIFIHSHPGGLARHSELDLRLDNELARVTRVHSGLGLYGSLVVAGTSSTPSFSARFQQEESEWVEVDRLRVVGEQLQILSSQEEDDPLPIFNRQVLAFGEEGQRILQSLRVGVVGAGGTGSAVIEQLTRLGVRQIIVIDPDALESTNITRVYGSGIHDDGQAKVQVAEANAARIGLGTQITSHHGTVLDRDIAASLVHCDVVIGCTDDNAGRMVLTRLAHTMLQLYIDCGVVIDSRQGVLFEIFARVSVVTPMTACLVCMDDINLEGARLEGMSEGERQGLIAEGYAPELETSAPSVITFTTYAASLAVNELLSRTLGYSEDTPANHLVARIANRSISRSRREVRGSHRCGNVHSLAAGMQEPFLDWWHGA